MIKYLAFFFTITLLLPPLAIPQKTEPTITDFRVQAMYRAAKLSWKVEGNLNKPVVVQIMRADTFEEGPYKEVKTINLTPGKKVYEYVDKSMGAEAKYYFKLIIKETGESHGPLPTRPYFSPPAT